MNTENKYKNRISSAKRILLTCLCFVAIAGTHAQPDIRPYRVAWNEQSVNSSGSMPLGNGDVGANVWVNKEGVLNILISKTDAFSEIGRLLKIGRIEVKMSPNILDAKIFSQELLVEKGMLQIRAEKDGRKIDILCRIDANSPVIMVEGKSNFPVAVEVVNTMWRTAARPLTGDERHSGYGVAFREEPFMTEVDTVLRMDDAISWCHENKTSIWQMTLDNQNISDFNQQGTDPLKGQIFGAIAGGENFTATDPKKLQTVSNTKSFRLHVVVSKSKDAGIEGWKENIHAQLRRSIREPAAAMAKKHSAWWADFWKRHYVIISSADAAEKTFEITRAYLLQRYMNACAGRGAVPIKFNGSIFTTDLNEDISPGRKGFDADFRAWGGNYWLQNTRLIYWTMYHAGDADLMKPFFDMYVDALPLARFRTNRYFRHEGAYITETMTPWGSYLIDNYGWDRKGKPDGVSDNLYIRYYWQGGLELCTMMMEHLEFTGDSAYFKSRLAPFIKEIITFFDKHYKRDTDGKLIISPAQSLETYQEGVVNPLPEIAGLHWNLERILGHAASFGDSAFIKRCRSFRNEIPEIPYRDTNGIRVISPGSNLGPRLNIENPELYAVFPYRLFGTGKPSLELGRNTFAWRGYKSWNGWHQDAIQAALLGHTGEAKKMVVQNFTTKHSGSKFPAFWGPNYDWIPDQDHGSVTARAIQNMLVQSEKDEILLFPAWPKEWNVAFRVSIPGNRILEGTYDQKSGVRLASRPDGVNIKIMID